jgi:hypothetical protein
MCLDALLFRTVICCIFQYSSWAAGLDTTLLQCMQSLPALVAAEPAELDSNETRPLSQHVPAARYCF